jgi:hypothetical protein
MELPCEDHREPEGLVAKPVIKGTRISVEFVSMSGPAAIPCSRFAIRASKTIGSIRALSRLT